MNNNDYRIYECYFDKENKEIVLSIASSYNIFPHHTQYHYRFEKIYIDWSATFNCKNEPSVNALEFNIQDLYDIPDMEAFYDTDIVNLRIPYDTLCYDVENDITFIFVQEGVYESNMESMELVDYNFFMRPIYDIEYLLQKVFKSLKINNDKDNCNVSCSDVNIMLAYTGFDIAEQVENYKKMVYFWNIINKTENVNNNCDCVTNNTNCNCHG